MTRRILLLLAASSLLGCASAEIRKSPGEADEGLRFYRPAPHLLITISKVESPTKFELESEIVWLPDYSNEYVVKTTGWLGSADLSVGLTDGWNLTSYALNRDSQAADIAKEVAGGFGSLIGTETAAFAAVLGPGALSPGL